MNTNSIAAALLFLSAILAASCGKGGEGQSVPQTGGMVARVEIADNADNALSAAGSSQLHLPPTIVTIRATVSAAGMDPVVAQFNAGTGNGTISNISVGTERTLTIEALDASDQVDYSGQITGIVITADNVTDAGTITLLVVGPNFAPTISGTPAAAVNEASPYSFTPAAGDADAGDTLIFSIANKPSWAAFSTITGALTGTPLDADVGSYPLIDICVDDSVVVSPVCLGAFSITVNNINNAPTISGFPATNVGSDQAYSFTPTAGDADAGDTLTFSIANPPSWAAFSTTTGALTGTPAEVNVGSYPAIDICVTDSIIASPVCLGAFSITVTDATPPGNPTVNAVNSPTNITPQNLTGSKAANSSIWIDNGAIKAEAVAVDASTSWSSNVAVQNGTNTFTITSKDAAGNESGSVVAVIFFDDTAGITVTPTGGLLVGEAGGTDTFDVVLDSQPTADVTILVSSGDTSEALVQGGDSPATAVPSITLTFTNADFSARTVTVVGQVDSIADSNQSVTITTAPASSADGFYNALDAADVTVTVADGDAVGVSVAPTAGLTTTEAGGTDSFDVVLNTAPTGDVVIVLINGDPTEVSLDKTSLTFNGANWFIPQTVTLTGVDDSIDQVNQTVDIQLLIDTGLTTDNTYDTQDPADVSVTNIDNDIAGVTVNFASSLITTEAGGSDSFTVVLNTQPTGDVIIDVTSPDLGEVTVFRGQLTFTATDWFTPQTVVAAGVDDGDPDGDQALVIDLSMNAGTADPNYLALNPPDVSVTNNDDDIKSVSVNPLTGLTTSENGTTSTFSVVLTAVPTGTVLVNIASSDATEIAVSPLQLTFTTLDWATPQNVTLTGLNDTATDGDVLVNILVTIDAGTADAAYAALDPLDPQATNMDNEANDEGTSGAPVPLDPGLDELPYSGAVGTSNSFYHITGLTIGLQYFVSVGSLTDILRLSVYSDVFSTTFTNCNNVNKFPSDSRPESCVTDVLGGTELWVEAHGSSTTAGANFILDVIPLPSAEGADDAPLDITALLPGYPGVVDGTTSFYVVDGLTPTQSYLVRLTALTDNVDLFVHDDVSFTNPNLCESQDSTIAESCVAQAVDIGGNGTFYLQVVNRNATQAATYTIDILDPPADEGTLGSPVDISNLLPYGGQMNPTASFYVVGNLIPNSDFTVSLSNVSNDVALEVFNDAGFSVSECTSSRAVNLPENCVATSNTSGNLYIQVVPGASFTIGSTYIIQVK